MGSGYFAYNFIHIYYEVPSTHMCICYFFCLPLHPVRCLLGAKRILHGRADIQILSSSVDNISTE